MKKNHIQENRFFNHVLLLFCCEGQLSGQLSVTKLKDEPTTTKRGLTRSNSSPNIAKMMFDEEQAPKTRPTVDRAAKPQPRWEHPSPNLPSGWEKRLDPNTRRYYYINHNKGTTQWEAPVNQTGQCQNLSIKQVSVKPVNQTGQCQKLSFKQVSVQLLVMELLEFCSSRIWYKMLLNMRNH